MTRKGFTLIELLVVISIIALLLSILMPGLSKARQKAQIAVCLSNTRTMGTALTMYTVDYKGYYPLSGANKGMLFGGRYPLGPYWDVLLLQYMGAPNIDVFGLNKNYVLPDPVKMAPYKQACKVFACPAALGRFRSEVAALEAKGEFPRAYIYNDNIGGGQLRDYTGPGTKAYAASESWRKGDSANSSKVKRPSEVVAMVCQPSYYSVNSYLGYGRYSWYHTWPSHEVKVLDPNTSFNAWRQPKTEGSSSFVFADGHSANLKYRYVESHEQDLEGIRYSNPPTVGIQGVKWHPSGSW